MKKRGLCLMGILLLVIVALVLPQGIFAIRDRQQFTGTERQSRVSLLDAAWEDTYETQTYARMAALTQLDLSTVKMTSVGYDFMEDADLMSQLERIFEQDWIAMLDEMTYLTFHEAFADLSQIQIQKCKKYMLYREEQQGGIALMMWYYDLYQPEMDVRIRLAVDSETDTIYYVKITSNENRQNQGSDTEMVVDYQKIYIWAEGVSEYLGRINAYYETEMEQMQTTGEGTLAESGQVESVWYLSMMAGNDRCAVEVQLPYGERSLQFLAQFAQRQVRYPDVEMGVSAIQKLIPEMMQE